MNFTGVVIENSPFNRAAMDGKTRFTYKCDYLIFMRGSNQNSTSRFTKSDPI